MAHKMRISEMWEVLVEQGYDVPEIKAQIDDIIIKTICTVQPSLAHTYRSCQPDDVANNKCFEILGFDVMLDSNGKPYLIEINHAPSFAAESPLDDSIKRNLLVDTFKLMNLTLKRKH